MHHTRDPPRALSREKWGVLDHKGEARNSKTRKEAVARCNGNGHAQWTGVMMMKPPRYPQNKKKRKTESVRSRTMREKELKRPPSSVLVVVPCLLLVACLCFFYFSVCIVWTTDMGQRRSSSFRIPKTGRLLVRWPVVILE